MKKLIISGGSGFLGSVIINHFRDHFDEIILLSRKHKASFNNVKTVVWDAKSLSDWQLEFEGADVIINMAGRSVDCRYTQENKRAILESRVNSTSIIGQAIKNCQNPPRLWINSSTATIYRHSLDKEMSEHNGEIGSGFSVEVAKAWEQALFTSPTLQTRKVALRTAIVLGKDGGAMEPIKQICKLGLGGKQGPGDQKFSWIHEVDFVRSIAFIMANSQLEGVFNIVAPKPSTNKAFMKLVRKHLNIPFGLPSSKLLLEVGAFFMRTETELVLKSRNVIPKKMLDAGFDYTFKDLDKALQNII